MPRVLFAVSGKDYWTLADGTRHPCGYWPEELAIPHEVFTHSGWDITIATPGQTTVNISGIDKQKVGQVAAEIRRWRKPEPYKGKGIKYAGEYIFRKEGKKK